MIDEERTNLEAETADKRGPAALPHVLPGWTDEYVTWRLLGGTTSRPIEVPKAVPEWALQLAAWAHWREQGERGKRPAFPTPVPRRVWPVYERAAKQARATREPQNHSRPSIFAGVGIFAAERPLDAIALDVDWVAALAAYCTPNIVGAFHQVGKRVFAWEEYLPDGPPVRGQEAVYDLGADGYVWTIENEPQRELLPFANHPCAVVCNTAADPFPDGWHCIAEGYSLINPPQTADQMVRDMRARGAREISVCVLPSDKGKRVPLGWYDGQVEAAIREGAVGVSVFRVETLGAGDVGHLAEFKRMLEARRKP